MHLNWQFSFKDNPLGYEMMARQVARQFCRLREVHSLVYGRRTNGQKRRRPNGLSGLKVCHPHTFSIFDSAYLVRCA